MKGVIQEALQFMMEQWRGEYERALHAGEAVELADQWAELWAWQAMREHFAWRGIYEEEEESLRELFDKAREAYFSPVKPETGA